MSDSLTTHTSSEESGAGGQYVDSDVPTDGLRRASPWLLIVLGLALYLPGIDWGLPAVSSWSQDTIAAQRTIGAVAGWPRVWRGRYPPMHYILLNTAYRPVLSSWERSGKRSIDAETGVATLQPPHAPKIGLLILVARCMSVVMAIATGLGVWMAARRLTHNDTAALLAAVALMVGAAFTYFAHLGNVDIPSMCWLAWSVYFYVRAVESSSWTDCLWLGLFAALAVTTKDAVAGMLPGMVIVLLVAEARRKSTEKRRWRAAMSALCQWRWLVGLGAFVLPYLLINGVLFDPQGYLTRMRYWISPASDSVLAGEYRHANQFALLWQTLRVTAGGVGWPMLVAMVIAVAYTLRRQVRWALIMLVPAVGYYVIVIAQIKFVYARFMFPPLAMVCILLGVALADLVRRGDRGFGLRWSLLVLLLLISVAHCVAVDMEMITDSRYEAEAWFAEHVEPSSSIGAFSKAQYLPRFVEQGYETYAVDMTRESFDRPQPDFLVLSSYNFEDFDAEQTSCMKELLTGQLGYELAVTFKGRHLGTGSSWLSLAGWGAPVPGKISPTVVVMRREEKRPNVETSKRQNQSRDREGADKPPLRHTRLRWVRPIWGGMGKRKVRSASMADRLSTIKGLSEVMKRSLPVLWRSKHHGQEPPLGSLRHAETPVRAVLAHAASLDSPPNWGCTHFRSGAARRIDETGLT